MKNKQKVLMVVVLSFAFVFTASAAFAALTFGSNTVSSDGGISLTGVPGNAALLVDKANSGTNIGDKSAIMITNSDTTTGNYAVLGFDDTADTSDSTPAAKIGVQFTDRTNHYGDIVFATRGTGGMTEQMRIASNGIVTIGPAESSLNVNLQGLATPAQTLITTSSEQYGLGIESQNAVDALKVDNYGQYSLVSGGLESDAFVTVNSGYATGLVASGQAIAGSLSVNTVTGGYFAAIVGAGSSATNAIGIQVQDVTTGTNKYAIKTGLGKVQFGDVMQTTATTYSGLPTCNSGNEGAQRAITDSTTNTWGATIAGSSTNHVLAYCDGTNWTVAAK